MLPRAAIVFFVFFTEKVEQLICAAKSKSTHCNNCSCWLLITNTKTFSICVHAFHTFSCLLQLFGPPIFTLKSYISTFLGGYEPPCCRQPNSNSKPDIHTGDQRNSWSFTILPHFQTNTEGSPNINSLIQQLA